MEEKIIRLKEIDSTNRFLRELKDEQEDEMVVAVTDFQTAGKGQGSHTWESEAGKNLLFSIKVNPRWVPVRQQFLLSIKINIQELEWSVVTQLKSFIFSIILRINIFKMKNISLLKSIKAIQVC